MFENTKPWLLIFFFYSLKIYSEEKVYFFMRCKALTYRSGVFLPLLVTVTTALFKCFPLRMFNKKKFPTYKKYLQVPKNQLT